ncbi:MAG: prolyl-tRNA synthetase, prolyl-tRNA synthetase, partial [Patescibacteria group bacterium]|nr:prolyl-tRNA synthetase, prolyl-tRNA synthetase [Patescibacteria group bacterium]
PDGQGEALYNDLNTAGVSVLYDDRDRSAGEKFADADLLGAPHRLIISKRSLAGGGVEWKRGEESSVVSFEEIKKELTKK